MCKLLANINVLKNDAIKSLTFLRLPERHQANQLYVLMQRFPRVITDMIALESEFLEYQATPDDEFLPYFDEDDKPMQIDYIWHQICKPNDLLKTS